VLGSQILDNDKTLKQLLEGDVLKGEVTINAIRRTPSISECLKKIDNLHLILSIREQFFEIEAILTKEIDKNTVEGTPILASSNKDIVLAALQQNGAALAYASPELKAEIKRSNFIAFIAPSNGDRKGETGKSSSRSSTDPSETKRTNPLKL
jgi:hypothetical protein